MTEDDAKGKFCPMSFNTPDQDDLLTCCASRCACWVQTDNEYEPTDGRTPGRSFPAGHCGLIR